MDIIEIDVLRRNEGDFGNDEDQRGATGLPHGIDFLHTRYHDSTNKRACGRIYWQERHITAHSKEKNQFGATASLQGSIIISV